jgi:hypothetical protein
MIMMMMLIGMSSLGRDKIYPKLVQDPKFEKIRNWSTKLQIKDYTLSDLFFEKSV